MSNKVINLRLFYHDRHQYSKMQEFGILNSSGSIFIREGEKYHLDVVINQSMKKHISFTYVRCLLFFSKYDSISSKPFGVRDGLPCFGAPFLYMGCLRTQWTRLPDLGKGPGKGNSDRTAKGKKLWWNPKSLICWLSSRGSRDFCKREMGFAD